MTADEAQRRGRAAGVISPRLADCAEHCTKMLGDVTEPMSEAFRLAFTQGCRTACEQQIAENREPPRPKTGCGSDIMSRMPTILLEQRIWCIRELHDDGPEANALKAAFEALKKSPEWLAIQRPIRRVSATAEDLASIDEGMRRDAHAARCRANQSAAMKTALEAFELHSQAWRARVAAASPEDQARMRAAMDSCIESAPTSVTEDRD